MVTSHPPPSGDEDSGSANRRRDRRGRTDIVKGRSVRSGGNALTTLSCSASGILANFCDLTLSTITRLARTFFSQQGRAVAANHTCREHQGLAQMSGAGIGKTVPEIETRRMAALAEPVEGVERDPRRLRRHRDHHNLNQRKIVFDRLRGGADRKIQHPRHRDGRLPHRQWRGQTRSTLLQARQKFARLVLVGQERGQRRGVDEHQPSSYRLSRNSLLAGWPFAGLPLARRSRQNWTPRSTKDGLPCSRSSSWASAACTASVRPIFFSAATLRASASVSGFLMWKAMARSSRSYRVSVYSRWDTRKEVVLVVACRSRPLSA